MFRTSITKPLTANRAILNRSFSALAPRMGEGDTGAPKAGGSQYNDQFARREAAQEGLYIKEKEIEKLRALKVKLKEQRKHLDALDKHIDELTRDQGGEKN